MRCSQTKMGGQQGLCDLTYGRIFGRVKDGCAEAGSHSGRAGVISHKIGNTQ